MNQSFQYYNADIMSSTLHLSKAIMSNLLMTEEAAEHKVNMPHIDDCARFFLEYSDEEFAKCLDGSDKATANANLVVLTDIDYTMSVEYSEDINVFNFYVCSNTDKRFNQSVLYSVESLLQTVNDEMDVGVGLPPFYMQLIVRIGRWDV